MERELLYGWKKEKVSLREIGRRLGRDHTSLSDELKRKWYSYNPVPHNSSGGIPLRMYEDIRPQQKDPIVLIFAHETSIIPSMGTEKPHLIDKIVSLWTRRGSLGTRYPVIEHPTKTIPPYLQLNEHGRTPWQQGEWEAMWQLKDNLSLLRDAYGIRIRLSRGLTGDLETVIFKRWTAPSIALEDVSILRRELAKYPPEFIRFCGITQFRFVQNLSLEDHEYWEGSKNVGGLASSRGPVYIASYGEDTIHHEIFHRADQQSGELNDKKQRKWKKLNKLSNPYLYRVYWDMSWQDRTKLPIDGFAREYGRVDVWEDRATLAELLMSDLEKLEQRAEEDEALANKAKRVVIDLHRWSGGRMNKQYFKDLKEGKVQEGYWNR